MCAAIWIGDRIGKRQNLVVIAVVVLQDNIDKNFVALPRDNDWFWMQHLFVLTELLDEFFDAVLVKKYLFLHWVDTLICERDFKTRIEKRQFP